MSEPPWIIGIDEVGLGSLYGPVIVCAAMLPGQKPLPEELAAHLKDSKSLSPTRRARARKTILAHRVAYAFGAASAAEVDELNPLAANMLAMTRAYAKLQRLHPRAREGRIVIDGVHIPPALKPLAATALPKADALIPAVSAASILAKEFRDGMLRRMARLDHGYGLEKHAGYGTAAHSAAIRQLGPSPQHRKTFIRKILGEGQASLELAAPE